MRRINDGRLFPDSLVMGDLGGHGLVAVIDVIFGDDTDEQTALLGSRSTKNAGLFFCKPFSQTFDNCIIRYEGCTNQAIGFIDIGAEWVAFPPTVITE